MAWLESRPIAARRVGPAERAWLWCRRRPAIASLSAAFLLALVGGMIAVIAVQARANTELRLANRRIEQRYDLAVEAINTFHTGVSEDFLLTQEPFKDLRDRLLRSARSTTPGCRRSWTARPTSPHVGRSWPPTSSWPS